MCDENIVTGWNMGRPAKGQNPLDHLQQAIQCYASAIENKPRDPSLHLNLGYLLEERYLAEDMYGILPTVSNVLYNLLCEYCFRMKAGYYQWSG